MDVARLRTQFPVLTAAAYLNAGTCGPVPALSHEAAAGAWRWMTQEGRGVAYYERLVATRDVLRLRYATLLRADPADVAVTTGTSEGVGRVVAGLGLQAGDEVVTADDEHAGLQGPLAAARGRGVQVRAVPLADVADAVGPRTRLVACSHVSWSSGLRAPAALAEVARDVPVLLDGAQGIGAVPVDVRALGCTFYAGSGQKWACGPVGTGALWVAPQWRDRVAVLAPSYGSLADASKGLNAELAPDARRFDAPAHDLPVLAGAVAALDVLADAGWEAVHGRARELAAVFAQEVERRGLEVVPRDDTTLVAWNAGSDEEATAAVQRLAERGVIVRALPGRGRLRASVGAWNDEGDLDRLFEALDDRRARVSA
jgi:L-cysteine/cystine lyase